MPDSLLLRGGTVVAAGNAQPMDVLVVNGVVASIGAPGTVEAKGATVLDVAGCYVGPGFVDIHTHLREPGREEAETVETGTRAAALGGYTAVVAMPNTEPTIDNEGLVRQVLQAGERALCDVAVAGAITVDRKGEQLAPMAEMAALGVQLFTDDGSGVQNSRLMLRALQYAASLDITLAQHCEDDCLSAGGHMHEGDISSRIGLAGVPHEAEEVMVMRDIALARKAGVRMHFLHLSTARSVDLVRRAKAEGLPVTAEATPHHFTLTHEELVAFDPVFKVNPPLRTAADRAAVIEGFADGTIDAVATDHAPHVQELKELPMDEAPCGMLGLETAASLAHSELGVSVAKLFEVMSSAPARIARLDEEHGELAVDRPANITVFDPEAEWVVEPHLLASKASNTPFAGRKMRGKVRHTIYRGEPVVLNGEATR